MAQVNVDELALALTPFEVKLGGVRYVGRQLSWPAYRRLEILSDQMREGTVTPEQFEAGLKDGLRAVFPPRWRYLLRRPPDPVYAILDLTPALKKQVIDAFFRWAEAWRATTPNPDSAATTISGPSAPASSSAGTPP